MLAYIALFVGKILSFILGLFNRGSALPGKIALRIEPNLLSHFKFPDKVIVVTGTNGKTSTTRYISNIFEKAGHQVMSNFKGANLHQGIVTEALNNSALNLRIKADVAVLEVDELTLVNLYDTLNPTELVMTNLFPDQTDRFGSVHALATKLNDSFTKETKLILNANDPHLVWIGESHPTFEKIYYGLAEQNFDQPTHTIDCPNCGATLQYDFQFYEHIGYFHCDQCDLKTPEIDVLGEKVAIENQHFTLNEEQIKVPQATLYTVYNTLAAVVVALDSKINIMAINGALKSIDSIKGRNETLKIEGNQLYVNMAKNPAGMNQSITTVLTQANSPYSIILAANNNSADGVSTDWLQDCRFDRLATENLQTIYVSGMVKSELAEVLINQDIPSDKIVQLEPKDAMDQLVKDRQASQRFIIANYTALDDLYAVL